MIALLPKHKGTEKLRADLRRRLAKLNQRAQATPKTARAKPLDHIEREGAGQVVLVGPPNSGKSSLLAAVTNAEPQIADYPFSTFRPTVGMMPFEDIQIQIVDLPPISEYTEPWAFSIIRNSDLIALVVDLSGSGADPLKEALAVTQMLRRENILIEIEEQDELGLRVKVKKAIIVGTKCDVEGAFERAKKLKMLGVPLICVSAQSGENLDHMKELIFGALNIVRVYTKKPGRPPDDEKPYILPQGSTVLEVAEAIHQDLAKRLRYVRIWGSAKYDGQQVELDYKVKDGDVIEIHA
jgi:hypothetical protein